MCIKVVYTWNGKDIITEDFKTTMEALDYGDYVRLRGGEVQQLIYL